MVIVNILLATICFSIQPSGDMECHNALVGSDTPRGTFTLQRRLVDDPLYGGDVLQFHENEIEAYAIHRVWLGRPLERRQKRIKSPNPKQRLITKGCINVEPTVFNKLVQDHSTDTLIIR